MHRSLLFWALLAFGSSGRPGLDSSQLNSKRHTPEWNRLQEPDPKLRRIDLQTLYACRGGLCYNMTQINSFLHYKVVI